MRTQENIFDYSAIRVFCGRCEAAMTLRRQVEDREGWHIHSFECEGDACSAAWAEQGVVATRLEVPDDGAALAADGSVHIRNISLRCGRCAGYPALAHFRRDGEWNVYTYLCESDTCGADPYGADPAAAVDLFVAVDRDAFARRDPQWRGGARHGGAGPE